MTPPTSLFGLFVLFLAIILVLAAVLMPVFVFFICDYCRSIKKTLAAMEHMMRHGK